MKTWYGYAACVELPSGMVCSGIVVPPQKPGDFHIALRLCTKDEWAWRLRSLAWCPEEYKSGEDVKLSAQAHCFSGPNVPHVAGQLAEFYRSSLAGDPDDEVTALLAGTIAQVHPIGLQRSSSHLHWGAEVLEDGGKSSVSLRFRHYRGRRREVIEIIEGDVQYCAEYAVPSMQSDAKEST